MRSRTKVLALDAGLRLMLFNGRFLARPATGVDRFARELLEAVDTMPAELPLWHIAIPDLPQVNPVDGPLAARLVRTGRRRGQAWEQIDLPRAAADEPLINLCNAAPVMRENQLVVIHDAGTVANSANYKLAFRTWYRLMHSAVMRRSRVVVTVSEFSADELSRIYGVRPGGIEIVSEGCEHILDAKADDAIVARLKLEGRPFVLALGSASPNKNFRAVAAAADLLADTGIEFVVAGGGDSRVFRAEAAGTDRLIRTGYVSDQELRALYERAMCFIFPSLYEGFGVPPLEAMRCGCPVVVSERASLPEICGDAALYCTALEPSTLAEQIRRLQASSSLRAEMRERGLAHAAAFTWTRAAKQFAEIARTAFA